MVDDRTLRNSAAKQLAAQDKAIEKLEIRIAEIEECSHDSPCITSQAFQAENNRRWDDHQRQEKEQRDILIESMRRMRDDVMDATALLAELNTRMIIVDQALKDHENEMQDFRRMAERGRGVVVAVSIFVGAITAIPGLFSWLADMVKGGR